jgi:SAM-dependent methyltransferase
MLPNRLYDRISQALAEQIPGTEVEFRFGIVNHNGRVITSVPWTQYRRILSRFSTKGKKVEEEVTDYINGEVRRRVSGDSETWIRKVTLWNEYNTEYGYKLSASREIPISDIPNFSPKFVRRKKRTSFIYGETLRLDFTELETRFEIELEILSLPTLDSLNTFLKSILAAKLDSLIVYTETEKRRLIDWVNRAIGGSGTMIDPKALVQARNLKLDDMVYGGLVGNPKDAYTITHKVDGVRKLLVFNDRGIWLAMGTEVNLIYSGRIAPLDGTILDGELVPKENRYPGAPDSILWFIPYDSLSRAADRGYDPAIRQAPHVERLNYAQEVADIVKKFKGGILTISTKKFKTITSPLEFFRYYREFTQEQPNLSYRTDGLIVSPTNSPYLNGSDRYPLRERILTRYPDICKIKPVELLTIDLQVDEGKLYSQGTLGKRGPTLFTGTKAYPLKYTLEGIEVPDGTVVEFAYQQEQLVPVKVRYDKRYPNSTEVALDTWTQVHKPLTQALLSGDTFDLVRRYHNRIKRELLSLGKGVLLDIGSGRGGDVSKWANYSHIYAVEPVHIQELTRRVGPIRDKVTIIQARGQDTEIIAKYVDRVDTISLMLSLSFFWENREVLDGLIRTIKRFLKPTGLILFLTIDGDLVKEMFEPINGPRLTNLDLGPAKLEYKPPQLKIDIPGTIVEDQTEWLVHLDDLYLGLGYPHFSVKRADGERFLTQKESLFTQMYSYGIISPSEMSYIPQFPTIIQREEYRTPAVLEVMEPTPKNNVCKPPGPLDPNIGVSKVPAMVVGRNGARDDTYLPINFDQPYDGQLVRIATIGDGSCFFHAILKAYYAPYANNPSHSERVNIVRRLRDDLAIALELINPETGRTYYEDANDGVWVALAGSLRRDSLGNGIDYSLKGIQRLLLSSRDIGDELYSYVADMLGLDIYIMMLNSDSLRPVIAVDKGRPAVIISNSSGHYELVGSFKNNAIQTVFWPDDPLISVIRCMFRR